MSNGPSSALRIPRTYYLVTNTCSNLSRSSTDLFDVGEPQLSGFLGAPTPSTISGAGANLTVAPGGTGTFGWSIVPRDAAALTAPQLFSVGGSVSCALSHARIT